ncbi:MAG: hypothetical protein AMXMBFR64_46680 [Myxococcales bacterium]
MRPSISKSEARVIVEALHERWGTWVRHDERFSVAGETDPHEARVTLTLERADGSMRLQLEARLDRALSPERDAEECTHLLLDVLDAWVGQYLESDRLDRLPLDWTDAEWGTSTVQAVQVRGERSNPAAEAAAEAWLSANGEGLDDADDSE